MMRDRNLAPQYRAAASSWRHNPGASRGQFPLTPALSPRERENRRTRREKCIARSILKRWKLSTLSQRERAGVRGKKMLIEPRAVGANGMRLHAGNSLSRD